MTDLPTPDRSAALLCEVADLIEFHPERYEQTDWFRHVLPGGGHVDYTSPLPVAGWAVTHGFDIENCGTTACIAGWACALTTRAEYGRWTLDSGVHEDHQSLWRLAQDMLGLDPTCAAELFSGGFDMTPGGDDESERYDPAEVADCLRRLAKYDAPRTQEQLRQVMRDVGWKTS